MGYLICSLKRHILFKSVRKVGCHLLLLNLWKHKERIQRISCSCKVICFFPHCFLQKLLHTVIELTKGFDVFHLEKVYGTINQCIYKHREDYDKTDLVEVIFGLCYSTFCHRSAVFVHSGYHGNLALLFTA